jgi:hypothetical protein
MNPLWQRQVDLNRTSLKHWDISSEHRRKVAEILTDQSAPPGRVCVVGAGNCNDLDLARLLQTHREIHLVDLDGDALTGGAARQGCAGHSALHLHGGVDVSGVLDILGTLTPAGVMPVDVLAACAANPLQSMPPELRPPFDLVVSTCLLSQLIDVAVHAIGEQHAQFLDLVKAIRVGHLRLLMQLTGAGGHAVLITDFVSSDSVPALALPTEPAWPSLLPQLIRERNFFTGLNPEAIRALFRADPTLNTQTADLNLIGPWRWNLGSRWYAVCAFRATKR